MPKILRLAGLYLFKPARGAEEARRPESLAASVWLYIAFVVGNAALFWLKPAGFPEPSAAAETGPGFWLKVMAWQPPLELAWIACLAALVRWFGAGRLPKRLIAGILWTAAPFALMAAYRQIPTWAFALGSIAWAALFTPLLRAYPRSEWRPLAAFMLGLNVIGLVSLAPMAAGVAMESTTLFNAAQIGAGLWMLWAGTVGLRALSGLRLPRAFMAILLSLFFQVAIAFTLYLAGLVPKEILKALLYA